MTLVSDPIVGSTRVVVLAASPTVVRGGAGEFRRSGLSIAVRHNVLAALAELVHDPTAMLVVSAEFPCEGLRDVLDLAIATCGSSVLLGMTATTDAQTVSMALKAGTRGAVDLPLTPERLLRSLRVVPPRQPSGPIRVGELAVDVSRHRVEWAGVSIDPTPREFTVLLELARRYPEVVPLDELARSYTGAPTDPHGAVRVTITHLRARMTAAAGAAAGSAIETVRGVGYRLAG